MGDSVLTDLKAGSRAVSWELLKLRVFSSGSGLVVAVVCSAPMELNESKVRVGGPKHEKGATDYVFFPSS